MNAKEWRDLYYNKNEILGKSYLTSRQPIFLNFQSVVTSDSFANKAQIRLILSHVTVCRIKTCNKSISEELRS